MLDPVPSPAGVTRIEEVRTGDLLDLARRSPSGPLFFWSHPESDREMLGLGVAAEIVTHGEDRLADAGRLAAAALACAGTPRGPVGAPLPRVVGGFAFDREHPRTAGWRGFPALRLVVPTLLWIRERGRCWLVRSPELPSDRGPSRPVSAVDSRPACEPAPPPEQWMARVRSALEGIERGVLEKVVLTRTRSIAVTSTPEVASFVSRLRARRPGCFTYWMRGSGADFFGSSPELLVRVDGSTFATESIAGTAARGATPDEDRRRVAALLASDKNRREQATVSRAITDSLSARVARLEIEPEVRVRSVPEAHHLATRFRGRLESPVSVFEVAALLHPTPAVCGTPTAAALEFIRRSDGERGWFTGAVGWMDTSGSGELAVALRSGLVDGSAITTAAGAGIVAGSDPVAEYEETELKLQALQDALEGAR